MFVELTSLLGREEEYATLTALITQASVHLLTITGTGGVGKTRLARAVTEHLRDTFADGVYFVDLSAVRDPQQVLPAIAEVLGCETGTRPVFEIVQAFVQKRHLLLVLDTFEQIIAAAPQVTALLASCPQLTVVVTSRERLRVEGEQEFLVHPLSVPDVSQQEDTALLLDNPAVALFIARARAQAMHSDIELTAPAVGIIAQICVQLDGLPLAIELAAARLKVLSLSALLARLAHRLSVLTIGRRDAPPRQQTLRNTIRWSYDLLSAGEQCLFRRACIFPGGCSCAMLEALFRELGEDPRAIFEGVFALLEKGLLLRRNEPEEEEPLFFPLETIREFGMECLEECGELEQVRQAHLRTCLSWAQHACQGVFGRAQMFWLRQFIEQQGNWRAAMQYALDNEDREAALLLGGWLSPIWFFWGSANGSPSLREGKHFLQRVVDLGKPEECWAYTRVCGLYGGMLAVLREADCGIASCQRAIALARACGDLQAVLEGLWMLVSALFARCDLRAARATAEEALALSQQHPEVCTDWGAAWMQGYSSFLAGSIAVWDGRFAQAHQLLLDSITLVTSVGERFIALWAHLLRCEAAVFEGRDEEARALLEQGVMWYRTVKMMVLVAEALLLQAMVAWHSRQIEEAATRLAESLHLSEEVGDERRIAWAKTWLARVAVAQHHPEAASQMLSAALAWAMRTQDRAMQVWGLEGMGMLAVAQHKPVWAIRLWGAAQALRERGGFPRPPLEQPVYDQQMKVLHTAIGTAHFQGYWKEGYEMTLQHVLLEEKGGVPSPRTGMRQQAPSTGLTPRERDVLRELAQGLTNAQIAHRLELSVVTVNSYLRSIYQKLDASSRTRALHVAYERHLLEEAPAHSPHQDGGSADGLRRNRHR